MVVFPGAKINIGLYVTGSRGDGYHNIETLFHPIGFSDILEVVPFPESRPGHIDLTLSGLKVEGPADANLVVRAYRLLHEQVGLPGVQAYLHKCIPTGAGLGGGSSDAAFMLVVLNRMFELNLTSGDLITLALRLGSDCPFFLDAQPSFAYGRGEELVPASVSLRGKHILLFHPGTGLPTAAAYRFVEVAGPEVPVKQMEQIPIAEWRRFVYNTFEPYAFEQLPVLAYIKEELYRSGALYASMTGSGSGVYGIFESETAIPAGISGYFVWKERL